MRPLGVAIKPRYDWTMTKRFDTAPSLADIDELARDALRTIPDELRVHARDVVIQVVEFPDDDIVREMGLASPFELSITAPPSHTQTAGSSP